ncbi:GerMN domain-containing protein [Phormidium sp. CCY1219]|uniref:GerMN domain-containing protein n=1 Tax=Phormidium sp. CCY1219 TaxID=2886104 RepID=UPI002D1F4F7E|nr:GerMN domain-containing protein [Phormidium sp. CCY1219]MEB3829673.1 GerMN domain-containing protein [Phormidium sp. CCY1219]
MQNHSDRRIPVGLVATVSALAIAVGGATAWWSVNSRNSEPPNSVNSSTVDPNGQTPSVSPTVEPDSPPPTVVSPTTEQTVEVFVIQDSGTRFELTPMPVSVQASEEPTALVAAGFEQLFAEPQDESGFSEIPQGTQLLNLDIKDNGVYVDLSPEFEFGGGSTSMTARLGQVVYTATTLDPNAPVWISVNGEPLEILGGEGLEIPRPITRTEFDREFPL